MANAQSMSERLGMSYSKSLLEAWAPNVEAVRSVNEGWEDEKALRLAVLLENTQNELNRYARLFEGTQPTDVGPFKKYAFDILTAIMPNLIAEEIVSVQPLMQKIGQIFFLKYLYGSQKGKVNRGDIMFDPYTIAPQGYNNINYSSELVDEEHLGASGQTTYDGNLDYIPLRPGTVSIVAGGVTATDDGNGKLVGAGVTGASTIDYATGAYHLVYSVATDGDLIATYYFDLEYAPSTIPQVDLKVEEGIVTARPRKMRALYAFDSAYDLKMSQGIDIDTALLEAVTAELKHEIDGEIMLDLYNQAGLASTWNGTYSLDISGGVSQRDFRQTFIDELVSASNKIFQATRRCVGNYIIVGKKAADVLESIGAPRFVGSGIRTPNGPHFAGTLDNKWKVYKNPYYGELEYLVGYKGDLFLDAGYVYAPYLPVFTTSLLMLDDFVGRRGFATSYGKRMNNNKLYVKGTISGM